MTPQEAIKHGKEQLDIFGGEHQEFIEMAIKALEQQPCEDCISRQAVIDGLDKYIEKAQSTGTKDDFISFQELVVKHLPSVTPKALEIELLTDTEQRIFLKAINREREVCQKVDDEYSDDDSKVSLVRVCNSIERKVKKIWE